MSVLLAAPACRDFGPDRDGLIVDGQARARGGVLFRDHCALCHGSKGDGNGLRRSGLKGRPADFTSLGWRRGTSAGAVIRIIRHGKPGTSMPAWRGLSDQEIRDLAAHVLSLAEMPGTAEPR